MNKLKELSDRFTCDEDGLDFHELHELAVLQHSEIERLRECLKSIDGAGDGLDAVEDGGDGDAIRWRDEYHEIVECARQALKQ